MDLFSTWLIPYRAAVIRRLICFGMITRICAQRMAAIYRFCFLFSVGVFVAFTALAQNRGGGGRGLVSFGASSGMANDTLFLDPNQDIAVQLMPFEDMVKIATAYSPSLRYQDVMATSLNEIRSATRAQILQNLSTFANYSTGNQYLNVTNSLTGTEAPPISGIPTVPGTIPNVSNNQLLNGYRVGVDLRLSLFDLVGRKHIIRQADANYKAALVQKDVIALQLRQQLIILYQDMITSQQILKARLLDEQASLAALRIAESEVQKGKITAGQLAASTNAYVQARAIGEQSKGDFLRNVHLFESLMGVSIQQLKRF